MKGDTFTSRRTAKHPEAYVASFAQPFYWANKAYRVTLESVQPGATKTGMRRFTIRFTEI